MLAIYDDSKTYIVDSELEGIVQEMRSIVRKEMPYKDIPNLPALRDKFMASYTKVLSREEKPVLDAIEQARRRVMEVLETKEYAAKYRERYSTLFTEIRDGAEHCNNVSSLRSYADKAEALKIRLLNEMDNRDIQILKAKAEEARRAAEKAAKEAEKEGKKIDPVVITPVKVKTSKNVSIKHVAHTSSWRLENKEDVDRYLNMLRSSLLAELEENDIVNVEF